MYVHMMVAGNTGHVRGLNREGLKRHGFSSQTISSLRQAYKILYRQKLTLDDALHCLDELAKDCEEVGKLVDFIKNASRGIVR